MIDWLVSRVIALIVAHSAQLEPLFDRLEPRLDRLVRAAVDEAVHDIFDRLDDLPEELAGSVRGLISEDLPKRIVDALRGLLPQFKFPFGG